MFKEYVDQILKKYFEDGVPLNDSIIEIAKEKGLNKEEIKRLIEMSNEATLLKTIELTGSQNFPVADPKVIFTALSAGQEKTASALNNLTPPKFNYEKTKELKEYIPKDLILDKLVKTAEQAKAELIAQIKENELKANNILYETMGFLKTANVKNAIDFLKTKIDDHSETGEKARKFMHHLKTASEKKIALSKLEDKEYLEKIAADILWSAGKKVIKPLIETAGLALKGTGHAVSHTVTKGGKWVIKNPGKSLMGGFFIGDVAGKLKGSFSKPKLIGNIPQLSKLKPLTKTAAGEKKALNIFKDIILPSAVASGTLLAAEKAYEGFVDMRQRQKAEQALEKAIEEFPELGGTNELQTRKYFETIYNQAPTIATDPLALGAMLKQFLTFGGPDIKTVLMLRENEAKVQSKNTSPLRALKEDLRKDLGLTMSLYKISQEKLASLRGIATAKLRTYFANSPEEVADIKRKEIEYGVKGKTIGGGIGLLGGLLLGKGLKGKVVSSVAGTLGGSLLGKAIGKKLAIKGKVSETPIHFNPTKNEVLMALQENMAEHPGENPGFSEIKRKIWLGL